ncbi:MAG: hypothetical protein ACI9R3_005888 [Verrucomicrobiales bacterium]|jgi:hypothetical protein
MKLASINQVSRLMKTDFNTFLTRTIPTGRMALTLCFLLALVFVARADIIKNVSIDGIDSWDGLGDPSNTILTVEVGSATTITGIAWDVQLGTIGASWLSEATYSINNVQSVTPFNQDSPGVASTDSGGILDLTDNGLPDITLTDSNGDFSNDFTLEFHESFDDVPGAVDANWSNGTAGTNPSGLGGLDFVLVPEPSSTALVMISGFAFLMRRRRS